MKKILRTLYGCLLFILFSIFSFSQSTGYINRQATIAGGRAVLDPNGDGYSSATTAGFGNNDVANSELPYRSVPSFSAEPFGDLRRGPSHLYSDFVPDANNVGYYTYFDGTNLLFRFRMGTVMSGSKGYSVLLDTDGKFGATGVNADPNYQPSTTGTNGNPGFEIEIVLETNFRIAIYNVDGTSSPSLVKSYTSWQDMSQLSIAGTFDNGDPDFFMDFYIPFSDLTASPFSLTTSTSIRMSATTVMSPQAAIGGPKSDIYGLDDTGYPSTNDQYEAYINAQPSFTVGGLTSGAIGSMCTAAPVVNSPIGTGTVNISGTWTKSSLSGAVSSATITVYKNGVSAGTVSNVSSGSTWTLNNIAVSNNDVITAKAQASGESMCLVSNSVIAQGCNTSNIPSSSGLAITCVSNRGVEGTFVSGNQVKVYFIDPSTLTPSVLAGPSASSPTFGYSGTNWYYNGTNYNGSQIPSACSGGAPDMNNGSYYVTTIASGSSCESAPVFGCLGVSPSAAPTITQTTLYNSNTQVSGTATSGALVTLRINGQLISTTTATGGNYSFTGLTFVIGDVVDVFASTTGSCISPSTSRTVTCYTAPPIINVDANNQITAGQSITGISSEAVGTTIKVYTSLNALVSTVTVQAGGIWTTAAYTAVAGTSYYATAQNGSCSVSTASGTVAAATATAGRCGSVTGPVNTSATTVSGTLTGSAASTAVHLYLDGVLIGTTTTSGTTWGPISVSNLFINGVLTIGVQESGKQEQYCSSSATTIGCSSGPAAPNATPATSTISAGQAQTYTVDNAVVGAFYGLADSTTGQSLGTGVWATSTTINLTTNTLSAGSYKVVIKGTSLSGVSMCSSSPSVARITANNFPLPVTFLNISAKRNTGTVTVKWDVSNEQNINHYEIERSADCRNFETAGKVFYQSTNSLTNNYGFIDNTVNNGRVCYRIKQVDVNGNYKYSETVSITGNKIRTTVSPNPAKDHATLYIEMDKEMPAKIELMDISGKTILQKSALLYIGSNGINLPDLNYVRRGIYIVKLSAADEIYYLKLILE